MPNRQEYIEFLLDHYENPRNRGRLEPADVSMKGGNPGCGDSILMQLRINPETQQVEAIKFEGEGCTISQAAASITTELLRGKTLTEIQTMDIEPLMEVMGREVVRTRLRCATLGFYTARAAVRHYTMDHLTGAEVPGRARESGQELGLEFEAG